MQPKGCCYKERFGYCGMEDGLWLLQAADLAEKPIGEPVKVELWELHFHHDEVRNCIRTVH